MYIDVNNNKTADILTTVMSYCQCSSAIDELTTPLRF